MTASINLLGQLVVTDLNNATHTINLNNPYPSVGTPYTVDSWQTFSVAASSTTTIYDATSTGSVLPVSPWVVLVIFPSLNLLGAYGVDATAAGGLTANAVWNSFPLTASQPFMFWRNAFSFNYTAKAAANNVFSGTTTGVLLQMQVKELTGTTSGTLQIIAIT